MNTKINLLILTLFSFCFSLQAQVFTTVPGITAKLNYSYVSDSYNIAIAGGVEHYISSNQGVTWTELNNGVGTGLYQLEGFNIAVKDASTMFIVGKIGSNHIVSKSTDGGANWATVFSVSSTEQLTDIATHGNAVIVSARNGVHQSLDGGTTWTFIQLSTLNVSSPFIRYNENGNSWIVSGYATGVHISTDDGSTWNEVDFGFASSEILAASHSANGVVLTRNVSTGSQLIFLNASNLLDTITGINENLLVNSNNTCKNAAFLPNNNLLTFDGAFYYIVDSSNQNVYHISYPYGNGYTPKSIALGATYGLAIGFNSPNLGRIYRIDLTQPPTLYVPSNFQIGGPGPCAGDNIVGIPYADYADSNKWYVNNVLTSTALLLNYPTPPGVYGTYTIKLNTYYNGLIGTTTKTVTFQAPQAPHSFAYTVDTTACYGLPLHVLINPDAGTPVTTAVKILYNGQLVAGPYNMTSANINAYTPALTTSGVLQIISYKTHYCDPSADTVTLNITIGPNLLDFNILENDSAICVGVNPELEITGTNSLYSYDFFANTNSFPQEVGHYQTPGNTTDTLFVTQTGFDNFFNYSQLYNGPIYIYLHVEVTDAASGCVFEGIIDTVEAKRTTAYFEPHSRSFERADTVHLSNAFIVENRTWSSPELNPVYIANTTNTIPLIVADTVGFFGITLHNEPLPGCADSITRYIHYADPAPEPDTICSSTFVHESDYQHHVRIDQFGNIYKLSVYTFPGTVEYEPLYIFRKMDPFGNLLWEKRATYTLWGFGNMNGIAIEDMDFDAEGNPVIAMWISGETNYQDDYFDFITDWNVLKSECYVAKIDKTTGELIWRTSLNLMPNGEANLPFWRITDVVVSNDVVYASTASETKIGFFTLKSENGHFVHSDVLNTSWHFLPDNYLVLNYSAGTNNQSYWSPQIDVLSSGEVVAIGYHGIGNVIPELLLTNSPSGIFVMKYDIENGIHDIESIAQPGSVARPKMFIDKNDNIIIASSWQWDFEDLNSYFTIIGDSTPPTDGGTFVFSMDQNYALNWLTLGTQSHVEDLAYAESTGDIYLSCRTRDNFSLGSGSTHLMCGKDQPYEITYNQLPNVYDYYSWLNLTTYTGFITKLDESGIPQNMKKFDFSSPTSIPYQAAGHLNTLKIGVTACGDLAAFVDPSYTDSVMVDGISYTGDSVVAFFFYSDCASDDCSYVNAPDTVNVCSVAGIIDVQLSDYYNLDSLVFDVLIDGLIVSTDQTALINDGHFSMPQPIGASDEFVLAISYPNTDTLVISYTTIQVDFGTIPATEFCETDPTFFFGNGTPAGGQYSGPGVIGSQFYPPFAGPGEHIISYTYNNQLGCVVTDTALFVVNDCSLAADEITDLMYKVYPNPFKDEITILSEGHGSAKQEIVVYDQVGRIILHQQLDDPKIVLHLKNLSVGNYVLEIISNNSCLHREQLIKM